MRLNLEMMCSLLMMCFLSVKNCWNIKYKLLLEEQFA